MICELIVDLLFGVFTDWIELVGFLFGVACVVMAMKNHIINWPLAIISSIFYMIFFWNDKLFSDAGLQIVFIGTAIFGWFNWNKMNVGHFTESRITRLTHQEITQAAVITLMAWRAWYWLLPKLMPASEALLLDTLTTCISISAVILQARRKLDCWVWWFIANSIFIPLYISRGYNATAGLYAILWVLSIMGWFSWRKEIKATQA